MSIEELRKKKRELIKRKKENDERILLEQEISELEKKPDTVAKKIIKNAWDWLKK